MSIAKPDIQQLKSIRDDLCNRFRENDKLMLDQKYITTAMARNTRLRLTRKLDKLTKQISALNIIIPHLESNLK